MNTSLPTSTQDPDLGDVVTRLGNALREEGYGPMTASPGDSFLPYGDSFAPSDDSLPPPRDPMRLTNTWRSTSEPEKTQFTWMGETIKLPPGYSFRTACDNAPGGTMTQFRIEAAEPRTIVLSQSGSSSAFEGVPYIGFQRVPGGTARMVGTAWTVQDIDRSAPRFKMSSVELGSALNKPSFDGQSLLQFVSDAVRRDSLSSGASPLWFGYPPTGEGAKEALTAYTDHVFTNITRAIEEYSKRQAETRERFLLEGKEYTADEWKVTTYPSSHRQADPANQGETR